MIRLGGKHIERNEKMKPIEIHIEGYKITISEDKKEPEATKEKEFEKITYIPYPVNPASTPEPDWWKYPYVTWTNEDVTITNTTDTKIETPVRDKMIGKIADE